MRITVAATGTAALLLIGLACGSRTAGPPPQTVTVTTAETTTVVTTTAAPPAPVPGGFRPLSFTAVSADTFWLLGSTSCSRGSCPAIAHTTDGGAHFAAVPAPHAAVDVSGDTARGIDTLRFATDENGFAFDQPSFLAGANPSAPVWETRDGGAHWQRLPFTDVRAFATGGGLVYLLRAACDGASCRNVTLARRRLAGGPWSATTLGVGAVEQLMGLAAHGRSIWVSLSEAAAGHPFQTLLRSADGGATFTMSTSPCTNGLGGELEPTSASVIWAVCPTGMLAGAARSTDAGATWQTLDVGRELANSARLAPASDMTAVIATGDQSELLRTEDGGATWVRVVPVGPGYWEFVGFTDPSTGTALRSGPTQRLDVLRSRDGGATWAPLAIR